MTETTQRRAPSTLTPTQRVVARRMTESHAVPSFTVSRDLDVTRLLRERAAVRKAGGRAPSLNDVLVAAVGRALRDHPRVNGSFDPRGFVVNTDVHVGVAVASEGKLLVPVVRHADRLSPSEVGNESSRLAEAVRSGTITGSDLQGATFTISNLGMMGIDNFTAMINVPQAAILAVGRARPVASFENGTLSAQSAMSLTLTADHRIVYGADAAAFLASVAEEVDAIGQSPDIA